ncbi:MAG TPA: CCA tRNA nucleotidyltransferase [Terriglobia bacterium]|jgi:poly(A) polymerase
MRPDSAIQIIRELRRHGHEAYLVGGCVRDMVMRVEPADYDIATDALPGEVMRIFPRTEAIGAQFGVVLVIHRGHPFEVATFRSDEAYVDGRRPTGVVFTNAEQDVLRRDFTINGLLYDPAEDRIIDYVHGQEDIAARIVRAIGDPHARFEEDKLRILRAVRFGARFGYSIEPATWDAVRAMAPKIHQVSKERIREEITRILTEGQAAHGFRMLDEAGLLAQVLPELEWTDHIRKALELVPSKAEPDFAMAVLLHETALPHVAQIVERLKFSRAEMHHIIALVENLPRFSQIRQMTVSALKRFFRLDRFQDHLELAQIHRVAGNENLDDYEFALRKRKDWGEPEIWPEPLITGDDLIAMGFAPGPSFKQILTRVEDEQLEGRLGIREEAVNFVKREFVRA